jgi:hypothetical protein
MTAESLKPSPCWQPLAACPRSDWKAAVSGCGVGVSKSFAPVSKLADRDMVGRGHLGCHLRDGRTRPPKHGDRFCEEALP